MLFTFTGVCHPVGYITWWALLLLSLLWVALLIFALGFVVGGVGMPPLLLELSDRAPSQLSLSISLLGLCCWNALLFLTNPARAFRPLYRRVLQAGFEYSIFVYLKFCATWTNDSLLYAVLCVW